MAQRFPARATSILPRVRPLRGEARGSTISNALLVKEVNFEVINFDRLIVNRKTLLN